MFLSLLMLDPPDLCSKGDEIAVGSRKVAEVGGFVEEGAQELRIQAEGPGFLSDAER
jgi:hypothetical protein